MLAMVLAVMLAANEGPAAAPAPPPPQTSAAPAQKRRRVPAVGDPDEVVCRVTDQWGSRMRQTTCRTRADWDARERELQMFFQDIRDNTGLGLSQQSQRF